MKRAVLVECKDYNLEIFGRTKKLRFQVLECNEYKTYESILLNPYILLVGPTFKVSILIKMASVLNEKELRTFSYIFENQESINERNQESLQRNKA